MSDVKVTYVDQVVRKKHRPEIAKNARLGASTRDQVDHRLAVAMAAFQAKNARSEDFVAYQDRIALIAQRPELLAPPNTFNDKAAFSRFLYESEPYVGAAIETLVEICSVEKLSFSRDIIDDYFGAGDEQSDIFVSFLNWFFNDYLFFGKYNLLTLLNTSLVDWFVVGEQLYYFNQNNKERMKFGDAKLWHPENLVPMPPEFLNMTANLYGFGVPVDNFELVIPDEVLEAVLESTKQLDSKLKKTELAITSEYLLWLKRKVPFHYNRGKGLVAQVHDAIRMKYQKKVDLLSNARAAHAQKLLFIKYGETGIGEEGYRDQEELEALAANVQAQIDNGSTAMVLPPDVELAQASPEIVVEDKYTFADEKSSIQVGLRVFDHFLGSAQTATGSGTKDLTLAIINDRIKKTVNEILAQFVPSLIESIAFMNKTVLKSKDITTRGIGWSFELSTFAPANLLANRLSEWERGIRSTEDYLGTEYTKFRTNRTKERESKEDVEIFVPRRLPHTMSQTTEEPVADEEAAPIEEETPDNE